MVIIIILMLLVLLLGLLLFSHLVLKIELDRIEFSIKLILFKVIKINIKEKTTFEKLKEEDTSKDRVPLGKIVEILKESLPGIRYMASKAEMDINFSGSIGLSSADKTAIAYGIINMLLHSMGSIFQIYLKKYLWCYNITPDFSVEGINYSLTCEVKLRLFYVIVFFFKGRRVLKKYKKYILRKGGAKNARSSNRRINENYNG